MSDYKLSHTAQEIDAKLKRIEEGGTGYTDGETVHPIDPKYLPGVCLPVVELSTTVERGATFTDAENAVLNEAYNTKLPFVVRANLSVESMLINDAVSISQNGTYEGVKMFALTFGPSVFQIVEQNGVWVVT